jgi:hypothetical protein
VKKRAHPGPRFFVSKPAWTVSIVDAVFVGSAAGARAVEALPSSENTVGFVLATLLQWDVIDVDDATRFLRGCKE